MAKNEKAISRNQENSHPIQVETGLLNAQQGQDTLITAFLNFHFLPIFKTIIKQNKIARESLLASSTFGNILSHQSTPFAFDLISPAEQMQADISA